MKFPIRSEDLLGLDVLNDEEATMVVIEAIVSDDSESLEFIEPSKKEDLLEQARQWERFEEYASQIDSQKRLFSLTVNNSSKNDSGTTDDEIREVNKQVFERLSERKSEKSYRRLSFVASFLLFALISSTLTLNMFNQSTESDYSQNSAIEGPRSGISTDNSGNNSAESGDFNRPSVTDSTDEKTLERSIGNSIDSNSSINFSTVYDLGPSPTETVFRSKILISQIADNQYVKSTRPEVFAKVIEQFRSECTIDSGFITDPIFVSEIEGDLAIGGFVQNQKGVRTPVVLDC